MSREERKMAQIIASIERMEQETRASGDDVSKTQEQHDLARQGGRGKKGKKGKASGVKTKPGKKFKVTAVAVGAGAKAPFERKLTPKKRWIQLWSAQMDTTKDGSSSEGPEEPTEEENVEMEPAVPTIPSSPVSDAQRIPAVSSVTIAEKEEMLKITEDALPVSKAVVSPAIPVQNGEKEPSAPVPASVMESKPQEQTTENHTTELPKVATTPKTSASTPKGASSSSELRVKTPLNNESSHLSPPLERNSPTTTASISPSAKVKDSDTPNSTAAAAAAAKFSPAATEQEKPIVTEKKELSSKESAPKLERKSSSSSSVGKGEDSSRRDTLDRQSDRGRKRSLERSELPMSEEAKRRAERRRKRKSNWDVGDPRKGGSPIADPPVSAAAAAANQQSFAKYPPNRPSWRHSQSMMDMKPHFQSGHRSSSFYNNGPNSGGRRAFYHSSSLPQDRSRSAGRSSARYSYGSSSSNGGTSSYR